MTFRYRFKVLWNFFKLLISIYMAELTYSMSKINNIYIYILYLMLKYKLIFDKIEQNVNNKLVENRDLGIW